MASAIVSGCMCLLSVFLVQATDCPDLWIAYSGSCYRFGYQAMTFFEAEVKTQISEYSSIIITVNNTKVILYTDGKDENDFLKEELTHLQDARFWIGLTDDDIEGKWVWYGANTSAEYLNWYPGQPDSTGNNEDCGEIVRYSPTTTKWNDVDCHALRPLICEKLGNNDNAIVG